MTEQESRYGTAKYDGGGGVGKAHVLKIKSGDKPGDREAYVTEFRIAPPLHSLRDAGKIVVYEAKHCGYYGINRDDPTKPIPRTFICTRERDWSNGGEIVV